MTFNKRPLSLLVLVIVVLTSVIHVTPMHTHAQESEDPISRIDTMLITLAEQDMFSGSVLVARDGEILLSNGYGLANREWDIPNTPQTKFRIGSITKQFTAMAILVLQEQGNLTVQDPICQYLEECPDAWQDITIYHLLTHTSGIPSFTVFSDYTRTQMLPSPARKTLQRFINEPLDFLPGTDWSYSDSGYIVLGLIIEEVTGKSYGAFLNESFFEPLGMEDTGLDSNTSVIKHRAEGYASSYKKASYIDMSIPHAAGALYSTVEDLFVWNQALYGGGGQVVSQESWDAMLESAYLFSDGVQVVYGLFINTEAEHPSIGHPGGIDGFVGELVHYTADNVTIVVLSNLEESSLGIITESIYKQLFEQN